MIKRIISYSEIIIPLTVIPLLLFSKEVSSAAVYGMKRAFTSVIPALFPFLIISSLISSSPKIQKIFSFLPFTDVFGLPRTLSPSTVLGYLTGFSSASKYTYGIYKNGIISKEEAQTELSLTSNVSAVFIISVIGEGLLKNKALGIYLYLINLFSSIFTGIITSRVLFKNSKKSDILCAYSPKRPFSERFTNAVASSVENCLNIAGFIVIFQIISELISLIPINIIVKTVIICVCDFTVGSASSLSLGGSIGIFLCGFAVGFGGILMFFQISSITENELSLKKVLIQKCIQGLICGVLSLFVIGKNYQAAAEVFAIKAYSPAGVVLCLLLFVVIIVCKKYKNNKNHLIYK